MRVAVIGGGAIGLASAWYLARAGAEVTVLERAEAGKGATWAAAGMLAAHIEEEARDPRFLALSQASQARWPGFVEALHAATGADLGLDLNGAVVAVFCEDEERHWRAVIERVNAHGQDRAGPRDGRLMWLDRADLRAMVPAVAADVRGGVLSPLDGRVDNRVLATALLDAVKAAGVTVRERETVYSIESGGDKVRAVVTGAGRLPVDGVVLAAGAWSAEIGGLPAGLPVPVKPIKGQMVALDWDRSQARSLDYLVWGPGIYCVPRADGRLILGATTEDVGFDPRMTAGGLSGLLTRAARTLPRAADLSLIEAWSGFRPAAPDGLPLLGGTAIEGLTIATGHHRNGILLTPVTAELVADLALGRAPRLAIDAFTPDRFARTTPGAVAAAPTVHGS